MALIEQQTIPKIDGNTLTGPTRTMSGYARFLTPTLDTAYGEKMRGIYVGVTGDVSFIDLSGNTQTLVGLAPGVIHPIWSLQINSAGTTATSIVVCS